MSQRLARLALAASLLAAGPAAAIEPTTVARMIEPGMVQVLVEGPRGRAAGSGFVVSAEGHVATNFHVLSQHLEAGWELYVVESGAAPEARRSATVVGAYPEEDLAVLKVGREPMSGGKVVKARRGARGYPTCTERQPKPKRRWKRRKVWERPAAPSHAGN